MAVAAEAKVFFKQNKQERSFTIGVRDGERIIESSLKTVYLRVNVLGRDVMHNPLFRRSVRLNHRQARELATDINENG
jgi:hypothetical protein